MTAAGFRSNTANDDEGKSKREETLKRAGEGGSPVRKSLLKDIPELLIRRLIWIGQELEGEPVSPVIGNLSEPVHDVFQVKQGGTARDYSRPYDRGREFFALSATELREVSGTALARVTAYNCAR